MITLEERINQISTLKEKCINNSEHKIKPFIYCGEKSDFEDICVKCGDFKINPRGIYSHISLLHYINSERFESLSTYFSSIKRQK